MAKTFYVSPGRAYVVAAASGTKITTKDGIILETVPSNAKFVILSVSVNEIIVNDDNAKVQQMYSAAAGGNTSSSSGGTEGPSIRFEVVQTLPATGEDGIIYLKPTGDTGDNKYEEWVWVNGEYEQMGSAKLDLDGYAVLSGGNEFSGDQEITGDVHIAGGVTVSGDVQTADSLMRESQVYLQSAIPTVLKSGHVYDLGVINSAQDLSGISFPAATGYVQTCEIWMETGATSYLITWPANSKWPSEVDGVAPTVAPLANSRHRYVIRKEADGTLVINKAYSYFV